MLRKVTKPFFALEVLALVVFGFVTARAQWQDGGIPVGVGPSENERPSIAVSSGGVTSTAWMYRDDIFLQRIDSQGLKQWPSGGIAVCDAPGYQKDPKVTITGSDRVAIAWVDRREGESGYSVSSQLYDSQGTQLWDNNGEPVFDFSVNDIENLRIISDGAGGLIVGVVSVDPSPSLMVQRIDESGERSWGNNGVYVAAGRDLAVAADGNGGVVLVWKDLDKDDVHCARIDSSGDLLWQNNVASMTDMAFEDLSVVPTVDGYVIVWVDRVSAWEASVGAQLVDLNGQKQWGSSGVEITQGYQGAEQGAQRALACARQDGGAVVVWQGEPDARFYAQAVDNTGSLLWGSEDVRLCSRPGELWLGRFALAPDGQNGAVCLYAADGVLFGAHLDDFGSQTWRICDLELTGPAVGVSTINLNRNGDEDFRCVWQEPSYVRVHRISDDGFWTDPTPAVLQLIDQPGDNGGWIRAQVAASGYDDVEVETYPISGYNMWRRIDAQEAAPKASTSADRIGALDIEELKGSVPVMVSAERGAELGFPEGNWVSVGYHAATQNSEYEFLVPTVVDSSHAGTGWETYCVSAHSTTPELFFVSAADSGYSVDNIPPSTPEGFVGTPSLMPQGYELSWAPVLEDGMSHYAIYRGETPEFEPGPSNRIIETPETEAFDADWFEGTVYYYKLAAVDENGNDSAYSVLESQEAPVLVIEDVPDDQGGQLVAHWSHFFYDQPGANPQIESYSIQRQNGDWESISTIEATQADEYSLVFDVPDIYVVGEPEPWATYRIIGQTSDPDVYAVSITQDAYSVDNIAPPIPAATIVEDVDFRYIVWQEPDIPDLAEMCVYRGTEAGFEPEEPIACPSDPVFVEEHLAWYFYRVQFTDSHGNLSEFSEELHGSYPTGAEDVVPARVSLGPVAPNPFNPRTTVHFSLPEPTHVMMAIYGIDGRRIAVLVDEVRERGGHEVIWRGTDDAGRNVASGAYFCRLEAGENTRTIKIVLAR